MGYSWTLYTPLATKDAVALIEKVYADLEDMVGPDLAAAADDGEYPDELGGWPEIDLSTAKVPSAAEERALLEEPKKAGVLFEDAAVERLAKCKSRIDIGHPVGLESDPTLVTALGMLLRSAGAAAFCKERGFDLTTSETALRSIEKHRDLAKALTEYEAPDDDDDDDDDDEEEDEGEDNEANTAEALHRMLAVISEHMPTRRRVGEALERATPQVQNFARHLAQRGPTSDQVAASVLQLDVRAVAKARRALAEILERAERRR